MSSAVRRAALGLAGGCSLGFVLAGCIESYCDHDPTYAGCTEYKIESASDLERKLDAAIELTVSGMDVMRRPSLQVKASTGDLVDLDDVTATAEPDTGLVLVKGILKKPKQLGAGAATVKLSIGGSRPVAEKPIWVRVTPDWDGGVSYPIPGTQKPYTAQIQTVPGSATGSVFVKEEKAGANELSLARYDWQSDRLIRTEVPGTLVVNAPALYSVNAESVNLYFQRFMPMPPRWVLRATSWADMPKVQVEDTGINLSDAALLASDPRQRFHVLFGLSAGKPTLEVFRFDLTGSHTAFTTLEPGATVRALAARQRTGNEGGVPLDFVTLGANSEPTVYTVLESSAAKDGALSTKLAERRGEHSVTAMALADLDQDGFPDWVFVEEGMQGAREVFWIPYLGEKGFGALRSVPLPRPSSRIVALAVGIVTSDASPDLAIVSESSVTVYANTN